MTDEIIKYEEVNKLYSKIVSLIKLIIPRFEHTWAAVQRTRTAHWIICLNPLISSCSNHSALSMVKPYGGVKRPIDRAVRLEQMANKRIKAMC